MRIKVRAKFYLNIIKTIIVSKFDRMDITVLNNLEDINKFRQIIENNNLNELSIDLEGDDLCRHGIR
jgi:hypothetical protein